MNKLYKIISKYKQNNILKLLFILKKQKQFLIIHLLNNSNYFNTYLSNKNYKNSTKYNE